MFRKKLSSLISIVLALCLICVAFAACADNGDEGGGNNKPSQSDPGLTISQETASLDIASSKTLQLTASTTGSGNYVLSWSSSDSDIATVNSSGLVTAVSQGTAVITVTCKERGQVATLATKSCTVTVAAPADYYVLPFGSGEETKNANVIANPGKWFFYTGTTNYENKNIYYMNGEVHVEFTNLTEGKQWFLRYQPEITVGKAYDMTFKLKLSTDAAVRLGGASSELEVREFEAGEHTVTLHRTCDGSLPFSVSLYTDAISETFMGGTFEMVISDMAYSEGIALSPRNVTIDLTSEEHTYQLNVAHPEGDTITWASSDVDVATVSDTGLVTGLKQGTAVVTATSSSGKSASSNITVIENKVEISQANGFIDLAGEKTLTLTATVADGSTVEWSSSDNTLATVEGGVVTALATGTVTITASSGGVSATCTIVIADSAALPTAYSLETDQKAATAKNEKVIENIGTWHTWVEHSALQTAEYNNGTITLSLTAVEKTVQLRYQPLLAVGTRYTVTFTFTAPAGVAEGSTFSFGAASKKTETITSGENVITGEFVVSASSPFGITFKLFGAFGEITISNISFVAVTE